MRKFHQSSTALRPAYKFLFTVISFSFSFALYSQSSTDPFSVLAPAVDMIPPSPSASSLGKYVDFPVSLHTGVPEISVPIHTIQSGKLQMAVSLDYHASGVRVEEIPGWIGLNWTLRAGAAVSRTVRGLPDEQLDGYLSRYSEVQDIIDHSGNWDMNIYYEKFTYASNGWYDTEPDIFTYSCGKYTGRFYLKPVNGIIEAVQIPYNALKIRVHGSFGSLGSSINAVTITTPEGDIYAFQDTEQTYVEVPNNEDPSYHSTWHISTISNHEGDYINFHYKAYDSAPKELQSFTKWVFMGQAGASPCDVTGQAKESVSSMQVFGVQKLHRITFPEGSIEFNSDTPTDFADTYIGEPLILRSIDIKDQNNQVVRSYLLQQGRFTSVSGGKILKLERVTEKSLVTVKPPYVFFYEEQGVPPLSTNVVKAQDHWGYYNGASSNNTLIPTTYNGEPIDPLIVNAEDDRETHPEYLKGGILKKVIYPAGGWSEYDYEPHNQVTTKIIYHKDEKETVEATGQSTSSDFVVNETTFTLHGSDQEAPIIVNYYVETDGNGNIIPGHSELPSVTVTDVSNGQTITYTYPENPDTGPAFVRYEGKINLLSNHTYTIQARACCSHLNYITAEIKWQRTLSPPETISETTYYGGLRIAKIVKSEPLTNTTLTSIYSYDEMEIVRRPVYSYWQIIKTSYGSIPGSVWDCPYWVRSSSNYANVGIARNHIVYKKVTVRREQAGNEGKTEHYFTYAPDEGFSGFPFPQSNNNDWASGLPAEKRVLTKNNEPVLVEQNNYAVRTPTSDVNAIRGVKIGRRYTYSGTYLENADKNLTYPDMFAVELFVFYSKFQYLDKRTVTDFEGGKELVKYTDYFYDSPRHFNLTKAVTTTSQDQTFLEVRYTYPQDYAEGAMDGIIGTLVSKNFLSIPIEQRVFKNGKTTEGQIIKYNVNGQPDSVFRLESPEPLVSLQEPPVNTEGLRTTLFTDEHFKLRQTHKYSSKKLIEYSQPNGYPTSYVWGYKQTAPVAVVRNAFYAQVVAVLGQSVIDELNNSPGSDENVRSKLQPLYTHPSLSNAGVTIYTYAPLKGITSVTDSNRVTTFYKYDDLGRLLAIEDKDHNVVKAFKYNYYRTEE